MSIISYFLIGLSFFLLYENHWVLGLCLFSVGGFLEKKLFFSLRSIGVVMLLGSISYGYHNGFTLGVIIIAVLGFLLACTNGSKNTRGGDSGGVGSTGNCENGWGFEFDSDGSFFGDSDGGGDGGGGGD